MVGIVAVALIVSQTPWFRDWVRRYIVRESKQYLNGELSIGRIGGNLLFGVEVSDIAVDVSGERIVAAKTVEVDYNVFQLISKGVVLNEIKLVEPVLKLERNGSGWNLAHLVKKQEKEADREGPAQADRRCESIEIADGRLTIDDHVGAERLSPAAADRRPRSQGVLRLRAGPLLGRHRPRQPQVVRRRSWR